jgi:CrcB protein
VGRWAPAAAVAIGGVGGAAAREAVDQALTVPAGAFPLPTFAVNMAGAFLLGLVLAFVTRRSEPAATRIRLLAGTGFMGAFTTYSTFAIESVQLVRTGHSWTAIGYVAATLSGGLLAAAAGLRAGRPAADPPLDPDVEPVG